MLLLILAVFSDTILLKNLILSLKVKKRTRRDTDDQTSVQILHYINSLIILPFQIIMQN